MIGPRVAVAGHRSPSVQLSRVCSPLSVRIGRATTRRAPHPGSQSPSGGPDAEPSATSGGPRDPQADEIRVRYRRTVLYVGRVIAPLCERFGVTVASDTFAAMVATLFIALQAQATSLRSGGRRA